MVITLDNVKFKYTDNYLLDGASFSISDSQKVGFIGQNGIGKSTVLQLITQELKPMSGEVLISGNSKISYLQQEPIFDENISIIDNVHKALEGQRDIKEFEISSILTKLGLSEFDKKVAILSGGQKRRLALAIALITPSDFLLLDEPTNHLDISMTIFLEKYLSKRKGALLLITHDRYFLERVCDKIIELDNRKIYSYEANYSKYLELKEMRLLTEKSHEQKQKKLIKSELEWIRRGPQARGTKQKGRIKRFEELQAEEFKQDKDFAFQSNNTRLGKKTINFYDAGKSFGDHVLFTNFNYSLLRHDIVGLIGENGAGKTTLFKIIMSEESLTSGKMELGETLKVGYFKQELPIMDLETRVIDYISKDDNNHDMVGAVRLLEDFLFPKDTHYLKLKFLSGGQRKRLELIRVLATSPNVLILDEPTNDLDIYTIELLEQYIEDFVGPVLLVSHDRYFLDKVCDKYLIFNETKINEYIGTYSEYLESQDREEYSKKAKKSWKQNVFQTKLRNELLSIPSKIETLEEEYLELADEIDKVADDYVRLMDISTRTEEIEKELKTLESRKIELEEEKQKYN